MSINVKKLEDVSQDCWESIEGHDFKCRILISPYNRRITVYEFKLAQDKGAGEMLQVLAKKASAHGLDKIWLKSKARWRDVFLSAGMRLEATIPGYYKGEEPAMVLSTYLSVERQTSSNGKDRDRVNKIVFGSKTATKKQMLPAGITLKWGQAEHCPALARLYSRVFTTYPFSVFDPDYLKHTMDHDVYYMTAWHNEKLIASAAAEINPPEKNAEVTDFATLPEWRGHRLASHLLKQLESRLKSEGFRCLYTIARSSSIGMNKVFANAGYSFHGVLLNNCNISGGFEDMNMWSKIIDSTTIG